MVRKRRACAAKRSVSVSSVCSPSLLRPSPACASGPASLLLLCSSLLLLLTPSLSVSVVPGCFSGLPLPPALLQPLPPSLSPPPSLRLAMVGSVMLLMLLMLRSWC